MPMCRQWPAGWWDAIAAVVNPARENQFRFKSDEYSTAVFALAFVGIQRSHNTQGRLRGEGRTVHRGLSQFLRFTAKMGTVRNFVSGNPQPAKSTAKGTVPFSLTRKLGQSPKMGLSPLAAKGIGTFLPLKGQEMSQSPARGFKRRRFSDVIFDKPAAKCPTRGENTGRDGPGCHNRGFVRSARSENRSRSAAGRCAGRDAD